MATAFIADLHLTAERPLAIALFRDFLHAAVSRLDRLYILGDLFEYWVGDDGADEAEFAPIIEALNQATLAGLRIAVMHGNRDFLLGSGFTERTGCTLLQDPHKLSLFGVPTLLSHGDALCTDDHDYLALRAQFHDPAWREQVMKRPLAERIAMARALRKESGQATVAKEAAILDVNAQAVNALLDAHGARRLIHGHTHRPGEYAAGDPAHPCARIVVGDWYEQSSVLSVGPLGLRLSSVADFPRTVLDVMGREHK